MPPDGVSNLTLVHIDDAHSRIHGAGGDHVQVGEKLDLRSGHRDHNTHIYIYINYVTLPSAGPCCIALLAFEVQSVCTFIRQRRVDVIGAAPLYSMDEEPA